MLFKDQGCVCICIYIHIYYICKIRDWLIWLWRLRSPMICCLWARDPGKPAEYFSASPEDWEPGDPWCKSQPFGRRGWDEMSQLKQWYRVKGANSSFCLLFFYPGSQWPGRCSFTMGKAICFIESIDSGANLYQIHLHRHTQKECLIWASHGQSSWYIQLTITVAFLGFHLCGAGGGRGQG